MAARKVDLLELVEVINSDAYRLKLPPNLRMADMFNIKNLVPFVSDDPVLPNRAVSRSNCLNPGVTDAVSSRQIVANLDKEGA